MGLRLVTPPVIEPITYGELIEYLRIQSVDEEVDTGIIDFLNGIITAARKVVEDYCNRALITQSWCLYLDGWPSENFIKIPKSPLQSITSINVMTNETLSADYSLTGYVVDTVSEPGRIVLPNDLSWPSVQLYSLNPIAITFVCGYGLTEADVDTRLRMAVLLIAADMWEKRESDSTSIYTMTPILTRLLWPCRVFGVM